jgi:bifunctional DNA-binding transcriptional regulator/antitoxin component of YhaV-PrlF toxin-antitoxin module
METTRLSTKGRLVLPKTLRTSRAWGPGTEFTVEETGEEVLLRAAGRFSETSLEQVAGCLRSKRKSKTPEQTRASIRREAIRRAAGGAEPGGAGPPGDGGSGSGSGGAEVSTGTAIGINPAARSAGKPAKPSCVKDQLGRSAFTSAATGK